MIAKLRLQNIIDCSHNDSIMVSIKCELRTCPNNAGWCYIIDNIHLKVFPINLKVWSIAINNGTATIDTPPADLAKTLMPAKQSQCNPLRNSSSKSTNSGSTITLSAAEGIQGLALSPMPQIVYQMMPQGYQHSYGLPAPYRGSPEPISHRQDVRSSSVTSGGDGVERLSSYIHWLVRKNPTLATSLFEAKNVLIRSDFVLETVQHIMKDEFTDMAISSGIQTLLKMSIKRFKRAEAKEHI